VTVRYGPATGNASVPVAGLAFAADRNRRKQIDTSARHDWFRRMEYTLTYEIKRPIEILNRTGPC